MTGTSILMQLKGYTYSGIFETYKNAQVKCSEESLEKIITQFGITRHVQF